MDDDEVLMIDEIKSRKKQLEEQLAKFENLKDKEVANFEGSTSVLRMFSSELSNQILDGDSKPYPSF